MKDIFKLIGVWAENTFKKSTEYSCHLHLQEEVNELHIALRDHNTESIKEEIADCMIILIHLSYKFKIDVLEEIINKHCINMLSDWKYNEDLGYHKRIK